MVHLGDCAVQVRDGEHQAHGVHMPAGHPRVSALPYLPEDEVVNAHPAAPPNEGSHKEEVAHEQVVIVVVALTDVEKPGKREPHRRRGHNGREANQLQQGCKRADSQDPVPRRRAHRWHKPHPRVGQHYVGGIELLEHVPPLAELRQHAERIEHAEDGNCAAVYGLVQPIRVALQPVSPPARQRGRQLVCQLRRVAFVVVERGALEVQVRDRHLAGTPARSAPSFAGHFAQGERCCRVPHSSGRGRC
mmetsp:Transcript_35510/g.89135  ORF Transcript_35510/g.89135 Transcript_35510/m.89135 type:complete len:247 (+) Transcript_35510:1206-1946(+)